MADGLQRALQRRHLLPTASLILLAWFAIAHWLHSLQTLPSSDDAMFLSVPKNWLNAYGWATSYSEKIPFNPDLTAGPALLLPAALLIKWFGNAYWVAGITGTLINLSLIILCLRQIRQYWPHPRVNALLFIALCIIGKGEDASSLIGYYTACLLFFLATLQAFNPQQSTSARACSMSILLGFGLLTKLLILPAFMLLSLLFFFSETRGQRAIKKASLALLLLLPAAVFFGGWLYYQQQTLSTYSTDYRDAWQRYREAFFLHHGSGIAQWLSSTDRWEYLLRNAQKNLYFIEEALKDYQFYNRWLNAPADERHIAAYLFMLLLIAAGVQQWRQHTPAGRAASCFCLASLLYIAWFAGIAMAMTPGHTYFPVQFGLFALVLTVTSTPRPATPTRSACLVIAGICAIALLKPATRQLLSFRNDDKYAHVEAMLEARDYLLSQTFKWPLAGCGYGSYPRHLEYLLPQSQNFEDCLNLIEDSVQLEEIDYFSRNGVDRNTYPTALEHFHARAGIQKDLVAHFHWQKPLNFFLVLSLQAYELSGRTVPLLNACHHRPRFRNPDILIMECRFEDLQKIDLDTLMVDIAAGQRWYKTRLNPYEGRRLN